MSTLFKLFISFCPLGLPARSARFLVLGTCRQVDLPLSRPWRSSLSPAYKLFDMQQFLYVIFPIEGVWIPFVIFPTEEVVIFATEEVVIFPTEEV